MASSTCTKPYTVDLSTVREGGEARQVEDDIIIPMAVQVRSGILRLLKWAVGEDGQNHIGERGERQCLLYGVHPRFAPMGQTV